MLARAGQTSVARVAELLTAAADLRARYVGSCGYGLIYGSFAAGTASETSDLDLVLIGPSTLPAARREELVAEVVALHDRFGLGLDREVSYEVKLHATITDADDAVALAGFPRTTRGGVEAPAVNPEPSFLNSDAFRLRLLLNALTVPHVYLGGASDTYLGHRRLAARATALLGLHLASRRAAPTIIEITEALVHDGHGNEGKDFLGYSRSDLPALYSVVTCGLGTLAREGIIDLVNSAGVVF